MANMKLMGAALLAAAAATGCCDKKECIAAEATAKPTEAAAATEAKDPNEALITVNGEKLTRGELDADVQKVIDMQGDKIPVEQLPYAKMQISNQLVSQFMMEKALGDKAEKMGYTCTDADVHEREEEILKETADKPDAPKSLEELAEKSPFGKERALKEMRTTIAIDKMIKAEVVDKDTKDYTADAQKIIDRITADNAKVMTDEQALAKIKELKAQIDAAEDKAAKFAELAKSESACPSGAKGGDLDYFTHGQMVGEFDKAAFGQAVGQISEPVKTQFGYHLILTTDKKAAVEAKDDTPAEPEKCRASHILIKTGKPQDVPELDKVIKYLKQNGSRAKVGEFVQNAVREAKIEASEEYKHVLPPPPQTEK